MNALMAEDRHRGVETDFYFIYTGHGAEEYGEGYVNLADGRLSRTDLFEAVIGPSQASYNHVVIDACQSYYMVHSRGSEEWREDRVPEGAEEVVSSYQARLAIERYPNTGVILSTSTDRVSHEWSAYASGVFSHQLRSALVGTADIDSNGEVDYLELRAYLAAANQAVLDPNARLNVYSRAPQASPQHPLIHRGDAGLGRSVTLATALSGRWYLQDERGVRYADFHKAADGPLVVSLLPGHAYTLCSDSGQMELPNTPAAVVVESVAWAPWALAMRSAAISEELRKNLYVIPFSKQFFDGYRAQHDSRR
jgi:hypothetical protein